MALHWLAPVASTIKRKACLIPWEIVFLWWIIDNNRWQSFGGNCYFWLSSLDFTQTSELRGSETDVERACRLYIPASLPCLVISVASAWTRVHSIPQRKMFLFFFSVLVSEFSFSAWRDEMKCSRSDSLSQHSPAPAAVELVTGDWLLHLSNPENNQFSRRDREDLGKGGGVDRGIKRGWMGEKLLKSIS